MDKEDDTHTHTVEYDCAIKNNEIMSFAATWVDLGVPVVAQWLTNLSRNLEVRPLALLSGLRTRRCCELWCRSQTRLRSHVAVALA